MKNQAIEKSKILIVDDQPLAQSYMKQSLESLGFRNVFCEEHAKSALALCSDNKFDLILCSFNLGKDKDGYQLYEELKVNKLLKRTAGFIFISAETDPSLVHSVVELQPDDFLAKPFSIKTFGERITKLLKRKRLFSEILDYIDVENYSKALKKVDEKLQDKVFSGYTPILLRMRGELLLYLNRIGEAKEFFKSVLSFQKFTWARVGLVESLILNSEFVQAKNMLELMISKPETRLVASHLLGKLELHLDNYQQAQTHFSVASSLAPRNISRQQTLSNISKLNHDHEKSYAVSREILKYAKHSIHDSPDIYLNVARAGVDYALTLDQDELVNRLTRQTNECLKDLKTQFPDAETQEQLDVVNARIHYLKDERNKALALVEQLKDDDIIRSVDDALDKAKIFHEVGFHQRANALFAKIAAHCEKYQPENQTLNLYLKQEAQEREDIKYSPKELNNHAVKFHQQGRYTEAVHTFSQAFRIMPKNPSIALNLLQALVEASQQGGVAVNQEQVRACLDVINDYPERLDSEQQARFNKIRPQLDAMAGIKP